MKQTSSALTFLMAQYRAIFKRAYVKGIATAVLLTAGLAAGASQAQAADLTEWGTDWNKPTKQVSVSQGIVTNSGDKFTNKFDVTGTVTVSGKGRLVVKDSMTLNNATLTISDGKNGSGIFGFTAFPKKTSAGNGGPLFDGSNITTFEANNSSINITAQQEAIIFNNVTLTNTNVTLASGAGIGAEDGTLSQNFTTDRGVLTVDGGKHVISGGAFIYGSTVNVTEGTTITMGTAAKGNDNVAELYASTNGGKSAGVLNLAGDVNVIQSGTALIGGSEVNLTGKITNSGDLILGNVGDGNVINIDGATITNEGKGYIWARADVVMTDGSIVLKDGEGMAGLDPSGGAFDFSSSKGVADFTASGGTITLHDADIAMLDVTLGGDVEVTLTGSTGKGATWKDNSHIDAAVEQTTNEGGNFTVKDNASIEMNAGSLLTAQVFNMDGGTITMQGTQTGNEADASGTAMIRAFPDAIINLNAGEIDITASKAGVIRGEEINLKGTSIDNHGTLTIGGYLSNQSGANTVAAAGTFNMTGGTLSNNAAEAILNFGVNSETPVNNLKSTFTIAGGTFTNAGTVNVASGSTLTFTGTSTAAPDISNTGKIAVASGAKFTTAGSVTVGGTNGTIELADGASGTFAGENVILNGILDVKSGANASITGKVTFNGDGNSDTTVDLKVASDDEFTLAGGSSLTIKDSAHTIGLTHTYGESGGTFDLGSDFNGINSGSTGTLYIDLSGVLKDASGNALSSISSSEATDYVQALITKLGADGLTVNLQGITVKLDTAVQEDLEKDNTVGFDQIKDVVTSNTELDQFKNATVTASSSTEVEGSLGQVQLTEGNSVKVAGETLKLNGSSSTYGGAVDKTALAVTGTGENATVAGATLKAGSTVSAEITGTGYIGKVEACENNQGTLVAAAGTDLSVVSTTTKVNDLTDTAEPTLADVGSSDKKLNTVQATGTLTAKDVYAVNTNVEQGTGAIVADSLTTEKANILGAVAVEGTINATKADGSGSYVQGTAAQVSAKALKADTATLAGQTKLTTMEATNATFTGGTHTISDSLDVTKSLVVTNGAILGSAATDAEGNELSSTLTIDATSGIRVDGNASIAANEINTSGDIYVGADATSESVGSTAGAGSLAVETLNLNGKNLIVDPAIGGKFSFVGVGSFSDNQQKVDAGVLNGNAYALQNAILAIGKTDEAAVSELFAQYINPENQSLGQIGDKVGSILYVAEQLDISSGKLVVDSTAKAAADGTFDLTKYQDYDAYIGDNSVLAISVGAATTKSDAAAIEFNKPNAQITASTSGKVVITGDYNTTDNLKLFDDTTGDGITIVGDNGLRVETLNGLLKKDFKSGETIGNLDVEKMEVNQDKVKAAYTDTSSSVRNSIISYVTGDTQWSNTKVHDINETRIHGAQATGYICQDVNGKITFYESSDGETPESAALTDDQVKELGLTYVKTMVEEQPAQGAQTKALTPKYTAYYVAQNDFLTAIREQVETRGAAAESAARMADFAGVAQVALKAGAATTDAIAGRMGMGAQNSAITFANNGQGAGIWVTPIYVSSDSDGFEAQGVDYGTDINLYGVALGGDYTLANGVRIGAMFNVGSGDADGQGAGSAVTSDFDYYGFGLYAGYSVGQFSIVGDVSYTAVDNDVEANTGIDKLETSLDSANLSVGVTGSYAFETAAGVTVTPHVGLRYSNIDIDDYSVKGKTYGTVGDYSADSLSVFSIPVGVTIASEFQAGTWSVKPSFDVTLTGNFGDDEAEGTFHWAGVENIDSSLNSEIFDNFTYGASLGIAAQSSSGISLGVAVGYTGSSNVDDFGVNANARFTF